MKPGDQVLLREVEYDPNGPTGWQVVVSVNQDGTFTVKGGPRITQDRVQEVVSMGEGPQLLLED